MTQPVVNNYLQFVFAREFRETNSLSKIAYRENWLQKLGEIIITPLGKPTELAVRKITHPVTVIALTALAALAVTIVFYPGVVAMALPMLEAWMVKAALYLLTEATILGWGIRAFGRIQNEELVAAWNNKQCMAIMPGSQEVWIRI